MRACMPRTFDTTVQHCCRSVLRGELLLALVAGHEHDLERLSCDHHSATNRTGNKRHPDAATRGLKNKAKSNQIKTSEEALTVHTAVEQTPSVLAHSTPPRIEQQRPTYHTSVWPPTLSQQR